MKAAAIALAMLLGAVGSAAAQQISELEFRDQPITDILIALGGMAGRSIVPDETVSGNASYYFATTDFDTALGVFLSTYKLHSWNEGGVTLVSRVLARFDAAAGTVSLDADDVDLRLIVRALSRALGKTILFDTLPKETLTVHAASVDPAAVLEILVRRFPDYVVEKGSGYFYLRAAATAAATGTAAAPRRSAGQARWRPILARRGPCPVPRRARRLLPQGRAGVLAVPPLRRDAREPALFAQDTG